MMPERHAFSRRRPPWWPEGEPWPPQGRPRTWPQMRHVFWRLGLLISFLVVFAAGLATLAIWVVARLVGVLSSSPAPVGPSLALLLLAAVGLALSVRSLRRVTTPLGDIMEATGRVAGGDYSTRVSVHGPREVRALARAFNTMSARLELNDEQRRNLMADVAHELRTPLTVIQGNLEGLLDGVYPRDDAHLAPILEETRLLSRLVEDLRILALTESGALKLVKEPANIDLLIADVVSALKPQANTAGVTLEINVANDLPQLEVDPTRIREVLMNLGTNALRYTPRQGSVSISASRHPAGRQVIVSVKDTGAGIPPADLPHIFERFYKSSDSRGSGLGLTIAKDLVTAHGGEIWAQSQRGQGTTVSFTLPVDA